MGQPGFFDLQHRYEGLDAHGDPLVAFGAAVPIAMFRLKLKTALIKDGLRRSEVDRKSAAGRKPWDEVLIFKVLVLQALYNLSDDQMEYQLRDRLSFMRFNGLGLEDAVPDAKSLWLYRKALAKAGAVEKLFDLFDGYEPIVPDRRPTSLRTRRKQRLQYCPFRIRQIAWQKQVGAGIPLPGGIGPHVPFRRRVATTPESHVTDIAHLLFRSASKGLRHLDLYSSFLDAKGGKSVSSSTAACTQAAKVIAYSANACWLS